MHGKGETRAVNAQASRNRCAGLFRNLTTPAAKHVRFLIASDHVWPEMAATIAALAFERGAQ